MKAISIAITLLIFITLNITSSKAEVLNMAANGFVIEIQIKVNRSNEDTYQQFLRINEWWDGEHSWFGNADNFSLDARAGGCFCETDGDKQVLHMTVSYVEPNKQVKMLGGLGPLQMMAVNGAMSWEFIEAEGNSPQTTIVHRYTVTGYLEGGLDKLAPIVDKVQSSQVQRLADRLNAGT